MFKILEKSFRTGVVTTPYPRPGAKVSPRFRGRPVLDFARPEDAAAAAEACPTGALSAGDAPSVDYGRCIFCGECGRMSPEFELAYLGPKVQKEIHARLGRALAIREVDSGSCNACEMEIVALNNPVYDIERFGIHFVASPRHADMLLVTGPVTRNMELALRKTYDATPEPKLVVAAGACAISGGIFGVNYATRGGVDQVLPVDVYIPGCPPRPEALLHGILLALQKNR
jgi:NADH-quinone oxidoreductase B subunit